MKLYVRRFGSTIITVAALFATQAVADSLSSPRPTPAQVPLTQFEITPFAAYRVGGSFTQESGDGHLKLNDSAAQGIIFNFRAKPNGQYELFYSRQSTDATTRSLLPDDPNIDLDIEHLQFGGTYLFDGEYTRPFIALTLGASRFDPNYANLNSESFFSASFGGGIQVAANKRFGVRLEARMLTTFVDGDSTIFCESDNGSGSCLILVKSNLLTQWEVRAGLVFRF